uniref:Golgi associated RAB2 interactor protein-like Rab2B-binding domain-containing protein n=1 Tax=Loxodonta africana TaxID=9785 RepID=G3ULH8_LOXAF
MIPLDLVHLYVHDLAAWRLKLRLATGRYYYLELDAPDYEVGFLFDRWIRLINLLQEPSTSWAPRTLHTPPPGDLSRSSPFASTWRLQAGSHGVVETVAEHFSCLHNPGLKLLLKKIQKDSELLVMVSRDIPVSWPNKTKRKHGSSSYRSSSDPTCDSSQTEIPLPEKPSITIRTIFSIISSTVNQVHLSESGRVTISRCMMETPSHCISEDSPDFSSTISYDQLEQYLWQQDIEDLMDATSTTLTSSSFSPTTHTTTFYRGTPYPSLHRHNIQTRPPASQKALSVPATSGKTPFILDQSQKVAAVPAVPQKVSIVPVVPKKATVVPDSSQKAPAEHAPPQKSPAVPAPSQKAPAISAVPQKAPAVPAVPQKDPFVSVPSQKAMPVPVPSQKAPVVSVPSQKKALTSPAQYQRAFSPLTSLEKIPADTTMLPAGSHRVDMLERSQPEVRPEPVVIMGAQETNVVEQRTQTRSLELPSGMTKKMSAEVLVSKTREVTLEGLKGMGKSEDKFYKKKEEIIVDLPGLKSKEMEQQKRWINTKELSLHGPALEHSRPFSVEGLALQVDGHGELQRAALEACGDYSALLAL